MNPLLPSPGVAPAPEQAERGRRQLPAPWPGLLALLERETRGYYGTRLVSLTVYGSVGRGCPGPESDIDFLIIARDLPQGRMARVAEFDPVERRWETMAHKSFPASVATRLSPVFKTPEESAMGSPLFIDMVEDARLLVDEGGFFQDILRRMREKMIENGARRIWRGNAWYWILKPGKAPGEAVSLL